MKKNLIISNDPVTTTPSFSTILSFQQRGESAGNRVRKWFIEPLLRMNGDQGFLVLLVLFPLYEKHLRVFYKFDGKFSEGNRIFRTIGQHLKLGESDAYQFWAHMRNGLLHQVNPKTTQEFEYGIRSNGGPIEKIDDRFWVNPFALRDHLIPIIEEGIRKWKIDDVPLALTFDPI